MGKVVSVKNIEDSIDFLNELDEKKFQDFSSKFIKEQPEIINYLNIYCQELEIPMELADEIFQLLIIVWKSYKNTGDSIPKITENDIELIENENEKRNIEYAKALGVDFEDENLDLSKVKELNNKINNSEFNSPDELVKYLEENKLEDFYNAVTSNNVNQTTLFDYVSDELNSLEDYDEEDINVSIEFLFSIISCFDKVAGTANLTISKPLKKIK